MRSVGDTIVVANVLAKNPFKMGFAHWNQEVEALAPDGSDEPFAVSVRLGRPDGRFKTRTTNPCSSESRKREKIVSRSWMMNRER
jgi:hypothetical protein